MRASGADPAAVEVRGANLKGSRIERRWQGGPVAALLLAREDPALLKEVGQAIDLIGRHDDSPARPQPLADVVHEVGDPSGKARRIDDSVERDNIGLGGRDAEGEAGKRSEAFLHHSPFPEWAGQTRRQLAIADEVGLQLSRLAL